MPKYVPPVKRMERGKYHYYIDGNGQRIPGVTTILGDGLPKKQLINWAANATAEGAVNHWDELSDLPVASRLKTLQGIRYDINNTAKSKGTLVHGYAARLVQGDEVTGIEDEIRPHVENYVRFLDEHNVQPILIETIVVNYTYGYAGTLDLVASLISPDTGVRETWLLDIKTGEKGIWPETALQLAAYRYAECYVGEDGEECAMPGPHGNATMPAIERTGAINVTSDDAKLVPTVSGEAELNVFRHAARIYRWDQDEKSGLILNPISMPRKSTARVVWEDE